MSVVLPGAASDQKQASAEPFHPARWGLTSGHAGLLLHGRPLTELAERYGSPLFVVDGERLARNAKRFLGANPARPNAPEVYYSYKTNPVPAVLARLFALGLGAEVVSPYELWLALMLGVPPERIIYNGPGKSAAAIREVVGRDLMLVNLNHREEIGELARTARLMGKRTTVGIRISTEESWSGKFGVPLAGGQALSAYEEALSHESLRVVALHAHRGRAIDSAATLERFVTETLAFCDDLHARFSLDLEMLDLGGSLAVPSVLSRDCEKDARSLEEQAAERLSIEAYLALIEELVVSHFAKAGRPTPRILLEPGRALTGETQMLLCQAVSKNSSDPTRARVVLDAGENIAHILHREYHEIFHVSRHGQTPSGRFTLDGPTCSPMDVLREDVPLPGLEPGETLAVMDAGAYLVSFSNSFCFPQPAIVIVGANGETLVRRRETYDDMVTRDQGPGFASTPTESDT